MSKIRTSLPLPAQAPNEATKVVTRVAFLVVPRFNMTTMMTMIEVMRIANYLSPSSLYQWEVLSFDGEEITASNGFTVQAQKPDEQVHRNETIFVLGSWNAETYRNPQTLAWIRRQARGGQRICSVELGCYLVARAGLLAGKRATTHWSWMSGFGEQFDEITVTEQLYTIDGQMMTCSGGLAGVITASAGNDLYHPIQAMFIGAIGAWVAYKMHYWVERKFKIDDAVGAVAVHGYAGFLGLVIAGFMLWGQPSSPYDGYATINPLGNTIGAVIMFGVLGFLPAYIVSKILNGMGLLRIPRKVELEGLDFESNQAYEAAMADVIAAETKLVK